MLWNMYLYVKKCFKVYSKSIKLEINEDKTLCTTYSI